MPAEFYNPTRDNTPPEVPSLYQEPGALVVWDYSALMIQESQAFSGGSFGILPFVAHWMVACSLDALGTGSHSSLFDHCPGDFVSTLHRKITSTLSWSSTLAPETQIVNGGSRCSCAPGADSMLSRSRLDVGLKPCLQCHSRNWPDPKEAVPDMRDG